MQYDGQIISSSEDISRALSLYWGDIFMAKPQTDSDFDILQKWIRDFGEAARIQAPAPILGRQIYRPSNPADLFISAGAGWHPLRGV